MVLEGSGHPPSNPGRVGTASRMTETPSGRSGTGRNGLPDFRDGSELPTEGSGPVGTASRRFMTGWNGLPEVQDGSGRPPGGPGLV